MLFFTVLGLTKAPPKLKKYMIGTGSNLYLLLIAICRHTPSTSIEVIRTEIGLEHLNSQQFWDGGWIPRRMLELGGTWYLVTW